MSEIVSTRGGIVKMQQKDTPYPDKSGYSAADFWVVLRLKAARAVARATRTRRAVARRPKSLGEAAR